MEGHPNPTFVIVVALAIGVVAQASARHLRVPGIVLLLAAGALAGPEGLGWIDPAELGAGLFGVVQLAVAIILFEGGLNLEISRLRREQAAIRRLVTFGALITLCGGTLAAVYFLDWSVELALLFGSLVVVTGPTVIGPLVSELRLRPRPATVLEAEGVLIDPVGAILAVLVLDLVLAQDVRGVGSGAAGLLFRIGFGTAVGIVGGAILAYALRPRNLVPEGFENITTLAGVLLLYSGAEQVVSESGILAVALAGVVVGNLGTRVDRDLREFKDQLTVLFIGLLFVLLAADVRLADVQNLGVGGLLVVGALILVVRPITVGLTTIGSDLSFRERLLVSWIAPRGIVAAAIASLTAAALDSRGMPGGTELRALVFLTIAGTVVHAGFTALPVAMLLGQRLPGRERIAILGAHGLSRRMAHELTEAGIGVVLLDSNPHACRLAEEAGFSVVYGNALESRTLQRARFESVGTAVGLTNNQELNGLFVTRARSDFGVPRGYVAMARLESGLSADIVRSQESHVLFEGPHDVERWDVRERHGELVMQRRAYTRPADEEEPPKIAQPGERYVFLAIRRGKNVQPMYVQHDPRDGDVASIAVHRPDLEAVGEALAAAGWALVPEEGEGEDAA